MEKLLKRFLYTGVGLVATTAEHLQKQINEAVEQAHQSEEEGKRIVADLVEDLKGKTNNMDGQWKEMIDKVLARFEFTSYEEVNDLKGRVKQLEEKIAKEKGEEQ